MHTSHFERRSDPPIKIYAGGQEINTRPYAKGGGKSHVIKEDQVFAGRTQGGGTRKQIYGTHDYGSGYPGGGILRGTSGRGFPFYFWPVVWTNPFIIHAGDAYLHPFEYGLPDNTTRPGGPLASLTYTSNMPAGSTFRILTDFLSAEMLITSLSACSSLVDLSSASPSPYLQYAVSPLPEQTLQYYRASSVALTLDGYNNTAALRPQDSSDSYNMFLPVNTDIELLQCLNTTIGNAVLLYTPPKGLGATTIFFIVIVAIVVILIMAIVLPLICLACFRSNKLRCRRNRGARRKPLNLAAPSRPCVIDPIKAPPAAMIVFPPNGESFSSGKAGELIEEDDVASLMKNAQAFAGTQCNGSVNHDRLAGRNLWWWTSFTGRDNKGFDDIEMTGKN